MSALQAMRWYGPWFLAAGPLAGAGCTQVEKLPRGNGEGIPASVQRVLNKHCANVGCHDGTTVADGLNLSEGSSASIIGRPTARSVLPLVELGSVDGSFLAQKILPGALPAGAGGPMPPSSTADPQVLADDLGIVIAWIAGLDVSDGGVADGVDDGMDDGMDLAECSVSALAPGVNAGIDAGAAMGQLPVEIGTALANNCGCHYLDSGPAPFLAYTGDVGIATHAQFQTQYTGGNPRYAGLDHWEIVEIRVIVDQNMPLSSCEVAGGGAIGAGDKELLRRWLEADAPDAPTWAGMGG